MATYKSQTILNGLVDRVSSRVAATLPSVVKSFDTNGNPVVTISQDNTPVAGEKVIVIRVQPISWPDAKDALGNTANQFGPHVIQFCTEANYAGTNDNIADILTLADYAPIFVEASRAGCTMEFYQTANGTVPSTAAMVAANLKSTWSDLVEGAKKSI